MIYVLAVLFILGDALVALGAIPISPVGIAAINGIGWLLAIFVAALPFGWPPRS